MYNLYHIIYFLIGLLTNTLSILFYRYWINSYLYKNSILGDNIDSLKYFVVLLNDNYRILGF